MLNLSFFNTKGVCCKIRTLQNVDVALGRIVEASDEGKKIFATPHGTILTTGCIYLEGLTKKDQKKLIKLEKSVEGELYAGKLTAKEIEEADKPAKD
jgi:hypothetical protein